MIHPSEPSRNGHVPGKKKAKCLFEWAQYYSRRGWAVIPTKGKIAACSWKTVQNKVLNESELRRLFDQPKVDGLAVILGPASGSLAVRDFDDFDSYEKWKAKHPRLARTLPTVKTARGYHVYFRGPDRFKKFTNGEYRGTSGQYVLIPPSRHPNGDIYEWIIGLPEGELETVNPYKAGLMVDGTQSTQRTKEIGGAVPSRDTMPSMSSKLSNGTKEKGTKDHHAIESAISATQPQTVGQRHHKLFALCRHLKAIPSLTNAKLAKLRPIVEEWHRRALPVVETKDFSETWADFVDGWNKVRSPIGKGPIDKVFQRAKKAQPSIKAAKLYPDEPNVVLLATFCRELQRLAGDGDFFLDCRTAGRLLGVDHRQALRWLHALCADGILKLWEQGSQAKRQANQYRYVAGTWASRKPH